MNRFSIRTLLVAVAVFSLCLLGIMSPTTFYSEVFGMVVVAVLLLSIPFAVGADGKLRRKVLSFLLIVTIYLVADSKFTTTKVVQSKTGLIFDLASQLNTGQPRIGAKGEEVRYFYRDGATHFVIKSASTNEKWQGTSEQKIKDMGLMGIAFDSNNRVSSQNLYEILNFQLALLLGVIGFFLAGYIYDRQEPQRSESP